MPNALWLEASLEKTRVLGRSQRAVHPSFRTRRELHPGRARDIALKLPGCSRASLALLTIVDLVRPSVSVTQPHVARYNRSPLHAALIRRGVPDGEYLRKAFLP